MSGHFLDFILRKIEGIFLIWSNYVGPIGAIIFSIIISIMGLILLPILFSFLLGFLCIYILFITDSFILKVGIILFIFLPYTSMFLRYLLKKKKFGKVLGSFERSNR